MRRAPSATSRKSKKGGDSSRKVGKSSSRSNLVRNDSSSSEEGSKPMIRSKTSRPADSRSSSSDERSGMMRRRSSRASRRPKSSRLNRSDAESETEMSETYSTHSSQISPHSTHSGRPTGALPAMLAKPELQIWNLLSELRRMPIARIERELKWKDVYEDTYGDLREFLEQWQVYFIISPFLDEVVLRSMGAPTSGGKGGRLHGHHRFHYHEQGPGDCGSCAYMSIAESFDTKKMQAVYDRRGLTTEMLDGDVLIVTYAGVYDLFLFPNGCTVWWGANREDHWVVEDDFTKPYSACSSAWKNRHDLADIDELFPSWQIFQVDNKVGLNDGVNVEEGLQLFNEKLMFDYFRVPEDSERKVKLMISAALTMAAKADYFEHVAEQISENMEKLKYESIGLIEHLKGSLRLNKPWMLEGALREVRLRLQHVTDPPLCVWDLQILQGYVEATTDQFNVESRINYVSAQCEAQSQALSEILGRWHRIFMIKSDFFLIVILVLDVFFLLFKLAYTMYFKKPVEDGIY